MTSTPFNILEAGIWENTNKEYYIVFVFLGVYTQNTCETGGQYYSSIRFLIGVERNMITLERTWIMFVLFTVAPLERTWIMFVLFSVAPLNPSHL